MSRIKDRSIQDLKSRVSLHDVVARVVALKKAGANRFKGLCPFHNEKTPSFHVSTDKGFYKCFGCGKAGDILSFVMETEGLQFMEAAEAIAQRFGVTLEYEEGGPSRAERSLRQELFDIHDAVAEHYRRAFLANTSDGGFIREYWTASRRFSLELAEEFKIGFAPADDAALGSAMLKRGFSEDALRQCGLFFVRDAPLLGFGAIRPRFRGRLMIPIRDHQGRTVAFTGRQLELTPSDDPARDAKYVNSPETPIFTKGNLLFNLDRARLHVGDARPFVLVEGQLDALRCWSVGLKSAIAPQGTSITDGQLALLRRYHPQVECLFDSDAAGQKAALRLIPLALRAGVEARFVVTEGQEKLDPDLLFLEQGIAAYETAKKQSLSAMAYACRSLLPDAESAGPEQKSRVARDLFEIVIQSESNVARTAFIEEIAGHLRVPPAALMRDFGTFVARRQSGGRPTPSQPPPAAGAVAGNAPTEEHLLFLSLHHEPVLKDLASQLPHEWIDQSTLAGRLLDRVLAEVQHNGWPGREHLEQLLENQEEKSLVASLLFEAPDPDSIAKAVNEGMQALQRRYLVPQLKQIELEIAAKGQNGDPDLLSLLKKRSEMTRQLLNPPSLTLVS